MRGSTVLVWDVYNTEGVLYESISMGLEQVCMIQRVSFMTGSTHCISKGLEQVSIIKRVSFMRSSTVLVKTVLKYYILESVFVFQTTCVLSVVSLGLSYCTCRFLNQ